MLSKAILLCWLGSLLIASAFPTDVSLAWDASPSPNIAGYKVYFGTASGTYGTPITIGNQTTYRVADLAVGTWYFAVTAFDIDGNESDFSNEVSTVIQSGSGDISLNIVTRPAIIQLVVSSLSTTSATIIWVTSEDCNGIIFYGTDPQRWLTVKTNNLGTTDHLGVISGLTPRTHYFYKAQSMCGEKTIESNIKSFNTK